MKASVRIAGSLLLSGLFLYFAARGVSWGEVREALAETHLIYIVPMSLGTVLPLLFRALRWQVLVQPLGRVRLRSLIAATAIGFMANMLLPLRAGEIVRPWVLSRKEPIRFSQAMATVVLERMFDMATLLLLFSVATLTLPVPEEWKRYGWLLLAVFAVFFVLLLVLQRYPDSMLRVSERFLRLFPATLSERLLGLARGFVQGLASLGSSRVVLIAAGYSLGVWLSISISFGFGLSALSLDVPWLRGALTITTFVAIAVSIPGGPGLIGMFQAGCVVALGVFDVSRSVAFGYSVLTHLVQFASTVLFGLYFFVVEGFRVSELRHLEQPVDLKAELAAPEHGNVQRRG